MIMTTIRSKKAEVLKKIAITDNLFREGEGKITTKIKVATFSENTEQYTF